MYVDISTRGELNMERERVHYRRYTPSRLHSTAHQDDFILQEPVQAVQEVEADTVSIAEKLIIQGIISGIILAVVLLLNVVNIPHTAGIRASLNEALSGHVSAEHLADEINRLLSGEILPNINLPGTPIFVDGINNTPAPAVPDLQVSPTPPVTTRIDEDILREAIGQNEASDSLQTIAPEPMAIPEL